MALQKKHKVIIGSFTSLLVIYMIVNSIFIYTLFVRVNMNYEALQNEINQTQTNTQSQLNALTNSLLETKNSVQSLNSSLKSEITQLKASVSSDFSGIIEDSIPAVVTVRTDVAQGTGFIITSDGYLVTNAHVLSGGHSVYVITSEQDRKDATLVGYDADMDIALLKISGTYEKLELGNSDDVQVGEKVIAIGNPLGLQFSVSEGIVSAVHRIGSNNVEAYIQTDAALNPGNSGGPLINKEGEVIGINNFKISGGESLGFALESNYIKSTINAIAQKELGKDLV